MSTAATQDQLAQITRDEFARYEEIEGQIYEQLQGIHNDTTAVPDAEAVAKGDNTRVADMQKRMKARYGVAAATGQAAQAQDRIRGLGDATNIASASNSAQLMQRDSSLGAMGGLVNQGNSVRSNAMSSLSNAAGMEAGREAQYQQAKGQHKAAMWKTGASLVGAGLTAAVLM